MEFGEAKAEITNLYPLLLNQGIKKCREIPHTFYMEVVEAVSDQIPFADPSENQTLCCFLFFACQRFDRWMGLSMQYVMPPTLSETFAKFVEYLSIAEGSRQNYSPAFRFAVIKNKLLGTFDMRPAESISTDELLSFKAEAEAIVPPDHVSEIVSEFYETEKRSLLNLIASIEDRSVRTTINTTLPYVLHLSPIVAKLTWKNIPVTMKLTPLPGVDGPSLKMGAGVQPQGPTRWQTGETEIEIELEALIDCDKAVEDLQAQEENAPPSEGSPQSYSLTFNLVHEFAWILRLREGGEKQWIPSPRDLYSISWATIAGDDELLAKQYMTPGAGVKMFAPITETLNLDIGELAAMPRHEKCRSLALMYLSAGETNEALFWLNVGIEAFFTRAFRQIAHQVQRLDLEQELASPRAFWAPAEEVVTEQFPAMAGRVQWPSETIHVSMFGKLKHLHRTVAMKTDFKEITKHYQLVQKGRNALFHGTSDERIAVKEVREAVESFDWIVQNFAVA